MNRKYEFNEVFDSQKLYRLLLEVMANPTRTVNIKEFAERTYGINRGTMAVAMTLLDNEVSFCTCGNKELQKQIIESTLSKSEEINEADFIFISDESDLESIINNAKIGSLENPHKSAMLIINNKEEKKVKMQLCGPGIKESVEIKVSDITKKAVEYRDKRYFEYPEGLDFIFISESGELFCIPRTTKAREVY